MISAIDTNVLSDIFREDPKYYPASSAALRRCLQEGAIIASEAVWAEVSAAFDSAEEAKDALGKLHVRFMSSTEDVCFTAGERWKKYRKAGGSRKRIISDFLIGAHALKTADRLLTRDRGFYQTYFKDLKLLDPTA